METGLQIAVVVIVILLTIAVSVVLAKAKEAYKQDAYRLLKQTGPDPKDVKQTVTALNRYVGRWRKDEEASRLIERLVRTLEPTLPEARSRKSTRRT